jgi:cation diffusion facilitator CzcD-associated flavoprotein CzcO
MAVRHRARLKKNSLVGRIRSLKGCGCSGTPRRPDRCGGAHDDGLGRAPRDSGKHDVTQANLGDDCEVAVIGAGPYGLAVAAHLRSAKISTRAFGGPMSFWREHMPRGMRLRSPWAATHIADPDKRFSLDVFAQQTALAPRDQLPIERFVQYGDWFARHAVPDLEPRRVLRVENAAPGFRLLLEDEEVVRARRVVVAMGLANQEFRPPQFAGSEPALVSHACEHAGLDKWSGKRVAVVGRGQSACESAALLRAAGSEVDLICRGEVRRIGAAPVCRRAVSVELAERAARDRAPAAGRSALLDRCPQPAGRRGAVGRAGRRAGIGRACHQEGIRARPARRPGAR